MHLWWKKKLPEACKIRKPWRKALELNILAKQEKESANNCNNSFSFLQRSWAHLATSTLPRQPGEEEGHGGQVSSKIHVVPAHEEVANKQQALDQQQPRCVCITCIAQSQNKHISWTFLHHPPTLTSSWGYSLAQLLPMFFHTGRWTLWVSGLRHVH